LVSGLIIMVCCYALLTLGERYIPNPRVHTNSRSFYFALAEMLRRWQWNFCKPNCCLSSEVVLTML
jgi:hypothetical protein